MAIVTMTVSYFMRMIKMCIHEFLYNGEIFNNGTMLVLNQ